MVDSIGSKTLAVSIVSLAGVVGYAYGRVFQCSPRDSTLLFGASAATFVIFNFVIIKKIKTEKEFVTRTLCAIGNTVIALGTFWAFKYFDLIGTVSTVLSSTVGLNILIEESKRLAKNNTLTEFETPVEVINPPYAVRGRGTNPVQPQANSNPDDDSDVDSDDES